MSDLAAGACAVGAHAVRA